MVRGLSPCALLLLPMLAGMCPVQRYTPPPPPLTVDPCAVHPPASVAAASDVKVKTPVCVPPAAVPASGGKPAAAEQFPFPGGAAPAAGRKAAEQFPYPGSAPSSPAAVKPLASGAGSSAGEKFPYPGETSTSPDAVPEGNTPRYVPDSPVPVGKTPAAALPEESSSSSSGSDSQPAESDDAAPADAGGDKVATKGRRHLPKVSAQSSDERMAEDLEVAKFYTDRGNFQAAYLRSKDATKVMPDDPEGHFALAQAAEKLHKKDEAVAEYGLYLKLDPAGERRTAAQRALAAMQ